VLGRQVEVAIGEARARADTAERLGALPEALAAWRELDALGVRLMELADPNVATSAPEWVDLGGGKRGPSRPQAVLAGETMRDARAAIARLERPADEQAVARRAAFQAHWEAGEPARRAEREAGQAELAARWAPLQVQLLEALRSVRTTNAQMAQLVDQAILDDVALERLEQSAVSRMAQRQAAEMALVTPPAPAEDA